MAREGAAWATKRMKSASTAFDTLHNFTQARLDGGIACFFVPRLMEGGPVNALGFQRLKGELPCAESRGQHDLLANLEIIPVILAESHGTRRMNLR